MGLAFCKNGHFIFGAESFYLPSGRCKMCHAESKRKYVCNHKEEVLESSRIYRKNNRDAINLKNRLLIEKDREKHREKRRDYKRKNAEHINKKRREARAIDVFSSRDKERAARERNKERILERARADRENLSTWYVAYTMGGNSKNIPPELIEVKRLLLQLKREVKGKGCPAWLDRSKTDAPLIEKGTAAP